MSNFVDNNENNNMELVDIDFGPLLGHLDVYQFNSTTFHENTLQINSKTSDNTGSRFYSGSHLACRFIAIYPELFENKRICEIGCGVGMVGICTALCTNAESIMMTDGNQESLDIANLNVKKYDLNHKISTHLLEWGEEKFSEFNEMDDNATFNNPTIEASAPNSANSANSAKKIDMNMNHIYNSLPYDIVVGCELMYFSLDMELMLTTIRALLVGHSVYYKNRINNTNSIINNSTNGANSMSNPTPTGGLMIHSHLFRVYEHQHQFICLLNEFQWETIEVEPKLIIGEEELKLNPHWVTMKCLISGPSAHIQELLIQYPEWKLFVWVDEDDESDEDTDSECEFGGLFHKMK